MAMSQVGRRPMTAELRVLNKKYDNKKDKFIKAATENNKIFNWKRDDF